MKAKIVFKKGTVLRNGEPTEFGITGLSDIIKLQGKKIKARRNKPKFGDLTMKETVVITIRTKKK
jgi:hypothetical protein